MQVTKNILIRGSLAGVFDTVATAKYWPDWHPATLGVSGAIDAPMKLGDTIRERARIGGAVSAGNWTVVEHHRPSRVVLKMPRTQLGDLEITYRFAPRGADVEFTRELQFDLSALPPAMDPSAIERQMDSDSAEALKRLKVIAENLLQ